MKDYLPKGEEVEDPAKNKRDDQKLTKYLQAIDELLSIRSLSNGAKHNAG